MLRLENLSAYYKVGSQKKYIFNNISFTLENNSFTALCGKNGCGKSTLLSLLDGIIPTGVFVTGSILFNEQNIFELKRKQIAQNISYLIQNEYPVWNITVFQFLETGFYSLEGITKSQKEELINNALNQFNILDLAHKKVFFISGGEFQKCRLARSFVQNNNVLLLDEPIENLDAPYQNNLLKILKKNRKNKTILFSIHDLNQACIYAEQILLFSKDKIILGSVDQVLTKQNLLEAYDCDVKIYNHPELQKKQILFV